MAHWTHADQAVELLDEIVRRSDASLSARRAAQGELQRLREIERRAREVLAEGAPDDDPISRGAEGAARRILGET